MIQKSHNFIGNHIWSQNINQRKGIWNIATRYISGSPPLEGWAIHEYVLDSHMFEITKGANHWSCWTVTVHEMLVGEPAVAES